MTKPKGPRGVPDLFPPDSELLTELEGTARALFDRYGYRRVETPLFEHTDVFERAVGETSEVVLDKQMYTFPDRRNRSLTLRPEATAGIARAFVERDIAKKEALPVRLSTLGWMFRYERPQKGRTRQFHQIDAECIGSAEPTIDAELITLASQFFRACNLEPQLLLNSMGDPADRERYFPALREALGDKAEDMCDDCQVRLERNPLRVFDCKKPGCRRILRGDVPVITEFLCAECKEHFEEVQRILESLGIAWKNDPHLVRGLDYYTRTVFEFVLEGFGARGTVCGGGRYDGLIELLGGDPTPAAGFAIGTEPVMVELRGTRELQGWKPDVYVVWLEGIADVAMAVALDLRAAGLKVLVADAARKIGAQLRAAAKTGAARAVILGPDEIAKKVATVRDLESSEQREVPLDTLVSELSA
ncbi:MAG TPA: histidine--tRNA ligase [Actinomycetota bacterium]|jgi:histidyl-tRNA synthetase|nr:histidine--tRNA ligase [Actinomycetota bacterium]